jgi:hypothetical protein
MLGVRPRLAGVHVAGGASGKLVVGAVVCAVVLLAMAAAAAGARDAAAAVFLVLLLADGAVLLESPTYFQHYAGLTAAPLALVLGTAAGVLARRAPPRVTAGVVGLALLGLIALEAPLDLRTTVGRRPPGTALQQAATRLPGCLMSDDPTVLVVADVLSRDLDRGCPLWPDVTGWTYDPQYTHVHDGKRLSRVRNPH